MGPPRRHIRSKVNELLEKHGVTAPPVPVAKLARAEGLEVVTRDLKGNISGFLMRDARSGLIGVNSHHSKPRQRFTIAHELGHFFLTGNDPLHVDHDFPIKLRSELSSIGVVQEEIDANAFAAELLMPAAFIHRDLDEIESQDSPPPNEDIVRDLARKYQVSSDALLIRIKDFL